MHPTWEIDQSNMYCVSTGAEQIATFRKEIVQRQIKGAKGVRCVRWE